MAIPFLLALGGAVSGYERQVSAVQARAEISPENLLDVGIHLFDPGLPENKTSREQEAVFAGVRGSEARYIPVQLKKTLVSTGQWGAVRVLPGESEVDDIMISGTILESSGLRLALRIAVSDATGRRWYVRKYKAEAEAGEYEPERIALRDPFQDLYDDVANDLLAARQRLGGERLRAIRRVALLRFGADLAPGLFADYLHVSRRRRYRIVKFPASGDPVLDTIRRIRDSGDLLVDTINAYYAAFCTDMEGPYDDWRLFGFEETRALEEIRHKSRVRKWLGGLLFFTGAGLITGPAAIQAGVDKEKEAGIHEAALKELTSRFNDHMQAVLGRLKLDTYSLEDFGRVRFVEWGRLLDDIFLADRGLPPDVNAGGKEEGVKAAAP
ncbi:MAG: hypothetical protein ACE5IK_06900 [Acidobacteriota bacterium]